MPAYFNISLQFRRSDIYDGFVRDFYMHLEKCGLGFRSVMKWGDKKDYTLDEIIAINQRKISENFRLGYDEDCSNDYKQIYYDFGGYSEVRGYWCNGFPENNEFVYEIIIPEGELIHYERKRAVFDSEKIGGIIELAKKIWEFPLIRVIQSELELSDRSASIDEIEKGKYPNCMPFVITEKLIDIPFRSEKLGRGYIFFNSYDVYEIYEISRKINRK